MHPATSKDIPDALAQGQRQALISLLADEDPAVYQLVRQTLLGYGAEAVQWLRPYRLSNDPVQRRRVQEILRHIARRDYDQQLLQFCHGRSEDLNLEKAVTLLGQTRDPDLNPAGYQALYDGWAAEIDSRLNRAAAPEEILKTFHQFFFRELGFTGDQDYAYTPESAYLHRVVDRRRGNPISLCTLYLFLSGRLRLPVAGMGMPYHFVCRYQSPRQEVYIDVFRQGRLMTKAQCLRQLGRSLGTGEEAAATPASPRRMFSRMCANLYRTYAQLEMAEEAARVQRYLLALSPLSRD